MRRADEDIVVAARCAVDDIIMRAPRARERDYAPEE